MPIDHLDPFATTTSLGPDTEDPERITAGRYRLPGLQVAPGGKVITMGLESRPGGWQRVTNMVKAIGDARALDLWHQRQLLMGLVMRPDLYDLACATVATTPAEELRGALEDLGQRVLLAAGADAGANLGTAFHGFTEAQDLGMMHYARRVWHGKLRNYAEGMAAQKLAVAPGYLERKVVVLKYGLAGTLDRILEDQAAGVLRIGDLKSQKKLWTWLEIAAQLAAYAMADAMWDRPSRTYVAMPKVDQCTAVVAWMPVQHPDALDGTGAPGAADGVDFFDVDLEKGRRALSACAEVIALRSDAKSTSQTWGVLRPAPELSVLEAYARRLDSVSSAGEGSALWAEITRAGLHEAAELLELAREVAQRFGYLATGIKVPHGSAPS
jgi:hypothetical protein